MMVIVTGFFGLAAEEYKEFVASTHGQKLCIEEMFL